jgi:hypothetical protein
MGCLPIGEAYEVTRLLAAESKGVDATDALSTSGDVLRAIAALRPDGQLENVPLPATPLLDTTLLTNAPGEPRIGFQLNSEVASADRIEVLMAFVRQTGIRPMLDLLRWHVDGGRSMPAKRQGDGNERGQAARVSPQHVGKFRCG